MGLGGRRLKGTWPRTYLGSSRTLKPIFNLIGETIEKTFLGVRVGVRGLGGGGYEGHDTAHSQVLGELASQESV